MIRRWLAITAGNFFRFVFHDEVRVFELFSAFNLLAWAKVLLVEPKLFERDSYTTFASMSQTGWMLVFCLIALIQLAGTTTKWRHVHEVRFIGFALASGAWTSVSISFLYSSVSTTAELNYLLLAFGCMISGAFIGWKKNS